MFRFGLPDTVVNRQIVVATPKELDFAGEIPDCRLQQ